MLCKDRERLFGDRGERRRRARRRSYGLPWRPSMTTVADRIVQRLLDAGVGAMFGMPGGGSNLDLIDAAKRRGLPFILTATETGAALAAIAHSDVSGGPGVCLTTLGPGVASVVNGVACARLDRAPLLVITDCHPASATAFEHQRI